MSARSRIRLAFLAIAAGAVLLIGASFPPLAEPSAPTPVAAFVTIGILAVLGALLAAWYVVDVWLLKRIAALAAETRVIAHGTEEARIPPEPFAALAPLPEAVNLLAEKLFQSRRRVEEAVAQSTLRVEEQKSRLGAILNDLHDGVLVCNLQHQILLYNRGALALLGLGSDLGLGRNLLQLVARDPVLHALQRLTRARGDGEEKPVERHAPVITAPADGRSLLHGRMGLVASGEQVTGYVLTLADATSQMATLGKCDALLREASEGLRAPLANLRAAAETLADHPDLPPANRQEFERLILDQSEQLSARFATIAEGYRDIAGHLWPMADLSSMDIIGLVAFRAARTGVTVTMVGLPQRLHGESHSLVILLGRLIERLRERSGLDRFDVAAEAAGPWVYIDVSWEGPPVPVAVLSAWSCEPLEEAMGALTVADVLQHHHSDLWSERVDGGRARLRLPLPPPVEAESKVAPRVMPPRPEFFDFDLLHQPLATGALGSTPLDQLTYVVFDTETTGLNPSGGDALVSIAGVRIVNGRILTGEAFDALINPGRPIPPASTKFHGITDETVRDCPRAEEVLPAFKAFVADAVLVAHNASFDLRFLKLKERAAGVQFDNPVLDTLILSRYLQQDSGGHSLDDLAVRLGLRFEGRHSALGDAMVTAGVFLRFVAMLKERGIVTLDDAIRRSNMLLELRAGEQVF